MPLQLASINIERDKHLERVTTFLNKYQPEVVCLQEVLRRDLPLLMDLAGPFLAWAPMTYNHQGPDVQGIAIVSRHLLTDIKLDCYMGNPAELANYDHARDYGAVRATANNHYVLLTSVHAGNQVWRVGTTHMPVTREGLVEPEQMTAIETMLTNLKTEPELVLTGDFNAPRGRRSFDRIAEVYTDNIPAHYTTSIDGNLHRAGPLPYMVDGVFTTPSYTATQVTLHTGVSDHCAVTALIGQQN